MFDPKASKDVLGQLIQLEGKVEGDFSISLNNSLNFSRLRYLAVPLPGTM